MYAIITQHNAFWYATLDAALSEGVRLDSLNIPYVLTDQYLVPLQ